MAQNKALELSIKIAGKVDKSLISAITQAQNSVSGLATSVSRVGTVGLAGLSATIGGIAAGLADCAREATQFADAMAPVVKYVDGLADDDGKISNEKADNGKTYRENYEEVSERILWTSAYVPLEPTRMTEIVAGLGQSGYDMNRLFNQDGTPGGVVQDAATVAFAWDIEPMVAADYVGKWETQFNIDHEEVMRIMDMINYLAGNSPTTAAELASAVNDSSAYAEIAGIDIETSAALLNAFLASGVDAGKAATTMNRITSNLTKGSNASKPQKEMWKELGFTAEGVARAVQKDDQGTIESVFRAINALPEERKGAALNVLFGQWAVEGAAKVSQNLDFLIQALEIAKNPEVYTGSMEREFAIMSDTPWATAMMRDSAFDAMKIQLGGGMAEAQKALNLTLRDFYLAVADMPELQQVGDMLGDLAMDGIGALGEALEGLLPRIQDGLEYLTKHGDQVASTLGKVAAVFAAMKLAPAAEGLLFGPGALLFGRDRRKSGKETGGLLGGATQLFRGGQKAAASGAELVFRDTPALVSEFRNVSKHNGIFTTLGTAISSLISNNGIKGTTELLRLKKEKPEMLSGYAGIRGALAGTPAVSAAGQYFGGIGSSLGRLGKLSGGTVAGAVLQGNILRQNLSHHLGWLGATTVGSKLVNGVPSIVQVRSPLGGLAHTGKTALGGTIAGAVLQGNILRQNLSHPSDWLGARAVGRGIVNGNPAVVQVRNSIGGWVGAKTGALMSAMAGAPLVRGVRGVAGKAAPVLGGAAKGLGGLAGTSARFGFAGLGVLGSVWKPALSGFGSLFAGVAPVVGVISAVIAGVSLLGDKFGGLKGILDSVKTALFGTLDPLTGLYSGGLLPGELATQLVEPFNNLSDKILNVSEQIKGLFAENGVANALSGVKTFLFGAENPFTGEWSGGWLSKDMTTMLVGPFEGAVGIIQAVVNVLEQLITFSTQRVKPILTAVFGFIGGTVIPSLLATFTQAAPTIASIVQGLGGAVMGGMGLIATALEFILPIIAAIASSFLNIASVVIPAVLTVIEGFTQGIVNAMPFAQGAFEGLIQFVTGVFQGDWALALDGVKQIFINVFDGLAELVKAPINAVIELVNKVLTGVSGLSFTVPDWVPKIGGKTFSPNFGPLDYLAKGGFTHGVSIAGEAGTEAVISFQSGVRKQNIDTWVTAGRMLGVTEEQAASAAGSSSFIPSLVTIADWVPEIGGRSFWFDLPVVQSGTVESASLAELERRPVELLEITPTGWHEPNGTSNGDGTMTITYAPSIVIQGNADREMVEHALLEDKERFRAWFQACYRDMKRDERRMQYR